MNFDDLDNLQLYFDKISLDADAFCFDSTESTNILAKEFARKRIGETNQKPFAIVAKEQTEGRGRFTRKWFSQKDASLCISVGVPLCRAASAPESFTIRAGSELCKILKKICRAKIFVKWPNDLYTENGKKICGILSEMLPSAKDEIPHWLILGVGLNVDFGKLQKSLDSDIADICADLKSVSTMPKSLCELSTAVTKAAVSSVRKIEDSDTSLPEDFAESDYLFGKEISVKVADTVYRGKACGVDKTGKLKLLCNAKTLLLGNGEATILKNDDLA